VAPLAPVVDGLTAPLAPVIDTLTAPLAPVVDGVVSALPPAVTNILPPRAQPQPDDSAGTSRPAPIAPTTRQGPPTAPTSPGHVYDTPATPPTSPVSVDLPTTRQPVAAPPQTGVAVDPRAPQVGSRGHNSQTDGGHGAFPAAPAFPAALQAAAQTAADTAASQMNAPADDAPSQVQPLPGSSGASASAGAGGGVAAATLFALLVSLAAFGLRHSTRLRLPSMAWRQQAFLAVIERPG
jgi:hypothetical protein